MPQTINTNISALNSQRNLNTSQSSLAMSLQRLSSGLRINSAKDDAAGLAISERMTAQIRGLDQANRNANDGVSLAQTAEAALSTSGDILLRIRELAIQAGGGTNSASDRAALNTEVQSLTQELQRIATTTEFNGKKVIDGSFASLNFQVGANANQTISVISGNFQTGAYGNNRIGGLSAFTKGGVGDLTVGTKGTDATLTAFGSSVLLTGAATGDSSAIIGATGKGDFSLSTSSGNYDVYYRAGASAEEISQAVNRLDSGVKASALTEIVLGDSGAPGTAATGVNFAQKTSYTFRVSADNTGLGGAAPSSFTAITFATGGTDSTAAVNASDQLNAAAQAFNDAAGQTGFTATVIQTDNGDWALKLANEQGKDLRIENASDATTGLAVSVSDIAVLDGDTATTSLSGGGTLSLALTTAGSAWTAGEGAWFTGRVTFDSAKAFSITTAAAVDILGALNVATAGTYGSQLQATSTLDVSTYDAAQRTLATVDSALASITDQRARYGATQARFESTISNLAATSENLSASRSRIRDTDFSKETTSLARSQILQQAGIAMLAQANQLGSSVLALLK